MESTPPASAPSRERRAASGAATQGRGRRATDRDATATARELVTQLWRELPPLGTGGAWTEARPSLAVLQRALAGLSVRAEALAASAPGVAPDAGALLGQTARSLHAMFDLVAVGGSHDVLLRVARLERWLALRAQQEPAAECAADLAMWVLEHLERASRP